MNYETHAADRFEFRIVGSPDSYRVEGLNHPSRIVAEGKTFDEAVNNLMPKLQAWYEAQGAKPCLVLPGEDHSLKKWLLVVRPKGWTFDPALAA